LKLGAKKAIVISSKPPRDSSGNDSQEFDEQIKRMKKSKIVVDIV